MGQCASKKKAATPVAKSLVKSPPPDPEDEPWIAKAKQFAEERKRRQQASWPNSKFTADIQSVVYEQIRLRRHPGTEDCRNFLTQIVLIRKIPKTVSADHYSDLDPSGDWAWYVTYKFNSFTHYLDGWEENRATRLAPVKMETVDWQPLLEEVTLDSGDVTWRYGQGHIDDTDYTGYEALVCPGRHLEWPKVSGVFGNEPQFPMYLMKGSIIKSLDASKPFAIPTHETAMKQGYLIALNKCLKVRAEEADSEQPDIVRRGVPDRVSSTAPYTVPIFELTENRGFLAPTW